MGAGRIYGLGSLLYLFTEVPSDQRRVTIVSIARTSRTCAGPLPARLLDWGQLPSSHSLPVCGREGALIMFLRSYAQGLQGGGAR